MNKNLFALRRATPLSKLPIEIYPLFAVIGAPLVFASWIAYRKCKLFLSNLLFVNINTLLVFEDAGMNFSVLPLPSPALVPVPVQAEQQQPRQPHYYDIDWDNLSPNYWSL
jgi:hypothetical protein